MALVWDKATFDDKYVTHSWRHGFIREYGEPSIRMPLFHYNWFSYNPYIMTQLAALQSNPGWASLTDIALIGDGFGWLAEALISLGYNVVVVETSSWVINNQNVSEEQDLRDYITAQGMDPDNLPRFRGPNGEYGIDPWSYWLRGDGVRSNCTILDNDLSTSGQRRNVRQALGNNIDALVTTFALDALSNDTESLNFADLVEQTRPNPACTVIHMILDAPSGDPQMNIHPMSYWQTLLNNAGFTDHWLVNEKDPPQWIRADGATF